MSGFNRFLAALAGAAVLCACPGNTPVNPPVGATIDVKTSQADVKANGKNVVTVTVSRDGNVPVTLTTAHGTWKDTGTQSTQIASGNGTATLVTCDSRGLGFCSGLDKIEATSTDGAAGAFNGLNFVQLELCSNGKDDNGDGKIDCADADCANTTCALPAGSVGDGHCDPVAGACVCNLGTAEVCTDGADNNCDGKIDCADSTCDKKACKLANGHAGICANSVCACGATSEDATTCGDGIDNDCDGLVDCEDPDCRPATPGGADGKACQPANGGRVKTCDFTGQCLCAGASAQVTETNCSDGIDNDCDGKIDCLDPNCAGSSCSTTSKTCGSDAGVPSTVCYCPGGATSETNCSDNQDNDCDGLVDCADPDCANLGCNAADPNYQCKGTPSTCGDITTTWSLNVTSVRNRIPADGIATTQLTAVLKNNGVVQANQLVTFSLVDANGGSTAAGSLGTPSGGPAGTTNSSGVVTVTFTSGAQGGQTQVVATYQVTPTKAIVGSTVVDQPALGQLAFTSQTSSILGVRFSSVQETSDLKFNLKDTLGAPYPAGLKVNFAHNPVGGSFIGASPNCTVSPAACSYIGTTDSLGDVSVTLHSGRVASVVSVQASATAGTLTANASATKLAIVGAKASGNHISLDCNPKNVPALTAQTCAVSNLAATITCQASFADRFSNVLGISIPTPLSVEAGGAGQPANTPSYDPAQPNNPTLGQSFTTVNVKGYSLPVDVDPVPSPNPYPALTEWSMAYNSGCGAGKVHNPRDGLVTIIVSASGEEGFVDQNANGVYDGPNGVTLGEPFIDLGEPFVDSNDNGIRDANEPFVDFDLNGIWTGPNGKWDSDTVIWTETRVLYTGFVAGLNDGSGNDLLSRFFDPAGPFPPTGGGTMAPTFSVKTSIPGPPTSQVWPFYWTDENFNEVAPENSYSPGSGSLGEGVAFSASPTDSTNHLGSIGFIQQFCQHQGLIDNTCANACNYSPCYQVSAVTGFGAYGRLGSIRITGGPNVGSDTVYTNAAMQGVLSEMGINGVVTP